MRIMYQGTLAFVVFHNTRLGKSRVRYVGDSYRVSYDTQD
jgi:hypothetical protein